MSWWSDLVLAVESAAGGESNVENTAGPATASVPPSLAGITTVIEGIWAGLTDGKLWRSVGWLVLGIILMLLGIAVWVTGQRNPVSIARRAVT